jgi:hypothetical protein
MIKELDNAKVLMISERGRYGYIKILGSNDSGIEVCYLAICKYDKSDTIYLFLCNDKMTVEQDVDFSNVEDAIANAQKRSKTSIAWIYPNAAV